MERTVCQSHLKVNERVARYRSGGEGFFNALFNRRYIFLWYGSADDVVFKLKTFAGFQRLYGKISMAVLSAAAGLADIFAFNFNFLFDGFAVGDLRPAYIRLHIEFAFHAVNDDIQVKLAHSADDSLRSFFVGPDSECRIFFREAAESHAHLLFVSF